MDFDELRDLIKIFEESGLSEIEVEENGRRMRLQKYSPAAAPVQVQAAPAPVALPAATAAETSPASAAPAAADEADPGDGLPTLNSPMVGTFYAAPSPDDDPFVQPGDSVEENQTVCIVEAMKLMNEVGAKFAGVVERVLVENGQPVEFGQPLYAIRPLEV